MADPTSAGDTMGRELTQRIAAVTDDASLDTASRDAVLARLKEAQGALQAAASARLELNRLAEERAAAPSLLAGLAAPPEDDLRALAEEWTTFSLPQLEISVSEADNLTRSAREQLSETHQRLADLRNQRPLFGAQLAAARDAASDAGGEVTRLAAVAETVQGTDIEQLLARARQQSLEARLALLQEQRDGADTREQLLTAQIAAAEHEVTRRDARLQALRAEIARRRLASAVADVSAWQDSPVGSNPGVGALARSFGDSVLRFRLYAWIAAPQRAIQINHELHMTIERLFRARGISIDFPQQDVHLYPAGPIEVRLGSDSGAAPSPVGGAS